MVKKYIPAPSRPPPPYVWSVIPIPPPPCNNWQNLFGIADWIHFVFVPDSHAIHSRFRSFLLLFLVLQFTSSLMFFYIPRMWWHENRGMYPCLSHMALDYLTIPDGNGRMARLLASIPLMKHRFRLCLYHWLNARFIVVRSAKSVLCFRACLCLFSYIMSQTGS
jgi:hypothetical protein